MHCYFLRRACTFQDFADTILNPYRLAMQIVPMSQLGTNDTGRLSPVAQGAPLRYSDIKAR